MRRRQMSVDPTASINHYGSGNYKALGMRRRQVPVDPTACDNYSGYTNHGDHDSATNNPHWSKW